MVAGSKINAKFLHEILNTAIEEGADKKDNPKLNNLIKKALHRGVPLNYILRVLTLVEQGYTTLNFDVYDTHYEHEGYITVSGQNSNNSVRVTNEFMRAVENDEMWELKWRTKDKVCKVVKARDLWEKINLSAWKSADPGLQFDTTINEWHTCPESGRINASNPCSEYMFLDDTACNLASLNLMRFFDQKTSVFDIPAYRHAIRLWTIVLEISVLMAQFPSKEIARLSYAFRTLGLGFANIGALLMVMGIPYDSDEGRNIAAAISSIMGGTAYKTSAILAAEHGPFEAFKRNKEYMLRVIRNHRRATYGERRVYEQLTIAPVVLNDKFVDKYLVAAAKKAWDDALSLGTEHGFRNAQTTVVAPTGTIGLVMDCDTTGIEPDFSLVKFKKLAGGGYFKIINQSVPAAMKKLGYSAREI